MKDFSKIIKSKEYEYTFWTKIIWQFSIENTSKMIAFDPQNNSDICLIIPEPFVSDTKEENILYYKTPFDDLHKTKGSLILAIVSENEYKMFKNNQLNFTYGKFEDGIEITKEDIPDTYKILK